MSRGSWHVARGSWLVGRCWWAAAVLLGLFARSYAILRCSDVPTFRRSDVPTLRGCEVARWGWGKWTCGDMGMRGSGHVEIWGCGEVGKRGSGDPGMQGSGDAEMLGREEGRCGEGVAGE